MEHYRQRVYSQYVEATESTYSFRNDLENRAPYLKHLIQNFFPKDKQAKIVDLGCGAGVLVHVTREMGYTQTRGYDVSPQQISQAKANGVPQVEEGDLMAVLAGTRDGTLDFVVTLDVVEHFKKEELIPFIDQVRRVLAPGGQWLIHTVNAESPFFGRVRYGDFTHELAFTERSIHQLLSTSGFCEIRSFEDKPIVHGLKSLVRRMLWELIRSVLRLYLLAESGVGSSSTVFSQNFLTLAKRKTT